MMPDELNRLFYLFGALRDEVITTAEFEELNSLLETNSTIQEYYLDYVYLCTDLCNLQAAAKQKENLANDEPVEPEETLAPPLTLEMLRVLGDYERKAETLDLPEPMQPVERVMGKVPVKLPPRKVSKLSIFTFAASLAAVLFLLAYEYLLPRPAYEVATLSDSVGAEWSHYLPLEKGVRLSASSSDPIILYKGVIEIQTDKDVSITVEGPAEFSFISYDEVLMQYGRLFANIPPSGSGFSVQTDNSKVIDLGTDFGIYADLRGETELHVFKGKTVLIAGQKGHNRKTVEVGGGQACRIVSANGNVTDIILNQNMFSRGIDSETGLLITGGKQIDLADIVGGGDGTDTGNKNQGIGWDGSQLACDSGQLNTQISTFPADYVPISWNPLIDGIFIPNGQGEEPQKLTSNAAELNLDEFIEADTNGQLTLILLHETSDQDAAYWFRAKESASDPDHYPTLTFPNISTGTVHITTAMNNGADAYVSNDTLRAPTNRLGKTKAMSCRYLKDKRIRIIFLRFDITELKGNLTNAILSLYLNSGNRYRDLHVYGLKDGEDDFWDEATLSFKTAPGILSTPFGNYQLDVEAFEYLGTFGVVDNRILTNAIPVTANQMYRWNPPNTQFQSKSVISNAGQYLDITGTVQPFMLGDAACGIDQNPSIAMHANAGITFDLDAIRRSQGPVSIESFTAFCGLSKPVTGPYPSENNLLPAASFYVLVNGKEVFSVIDVSPQDVPQWIDIPLDRQARYLTLVVTQGTDSSITDGHCLFLKPVLNLK